MQEKVYKTKIANVDEFSDRNRIVNARGELDQRVIDAAVRQWRACTIYALVCLSTGDLIEHIL